MREHILSADCWCNPQRFDYRQGAVPVSPGDSHSGDVRESEHRSREYPVREFDSPRLHDGEVRE